ncbi:hypothetical protein ScPMuIL_015389 [Solemya velum]
MFKVSFTPLPDMLILRRLTGLTFLILGVHIVINRHSFVSLLGSSTFPAATYMLLATSAIVLLVGIVGCIGACTDNRGCLVIYAICLLVIMLLEAVAGVLAYMYESMIREELTRNLNRTMSQEYTFDQDITNAVDEMQRQFKCCGAESFKDWKYSMWLKTDNNTSNKAPDSCCITESKHCAASDHHSNIHYDSCRSSLEDYTRESLILIGGVGLGLCFIQIFGIIFSCCLVRKIKASKYKY